MPSIRFFCEDRTIKLPKPRKTTSWIKSVIESESYELLHLNYIFCSDDYLRQINVEYLHHVTFTDIVTFDNSEEDGKVEADIFISIDRVKENSMTFARPFQEELHRVLIHGVLHLMGYKDKDPRQKAEMRKKEDAYLSLTGVPRETFKS
jgi:probable rRNA maturation factor